MLIAKSFFAVSDFPVPFVQGHRVIENITDISTLYRWTGDEILTNPGSGKSDQDAEASMNGPNSLPASEFPLEAVMTATFLYTAG